MPEERTRRFPPPWTVEQTPGGYKVKDANGQSLACVYGRETKGEADIAQGRTRRRGVRACLGVLVPALLLQVLDALLQIGQHCITAWIVETKGPTIAPSYAPSTRQPHGSECSSDNLAFVMVKMTVDVLAYLNDVPLAAGIRGNQFEDRSASVFDFAPRYRFLPHLKFSPCEKGPDGWGCRGPSWVSAHVWTPLRGLAGPERKGFER